MSVRISRGGSDVQSATPVAVGTTTETSANGVEAGNALTMLQVLRELDRLQVSVGDLSAARTRLEASVTRIEATVEGLAATNADLSRTLRGAPSKLLIWIVAIVLVILIAAAVVFEPTIQLWLAAVRV